MLITLAKTTKHQRRGQAIGRYLGITNNLITDCLPRCRRCGRDDRETRPFIPTTTFPDRPAPTDEFAQCPIQG